MTGEEKDVPLTTNPSTHDDSSPAVARIESQFTIAGITKDETKYHHVVAAIETDVIAQVSDIILNPPEELKYEALKERLIEQFADSETHRLKLLLQELQLGDNRPTQLLCKMRDLSSKVPEDLLKNLWLQRLPTAVQQILAVSTGDVDALAKMADKHGQTLQNTLQLQSGKLERPSLEATSVYGQPKRMILADKSTGFRFLIDTGAEISVIPPRTIQEKNCTASKLKLFAANGTTISTFGEKLLTLDLNLRRVFRWPFIIASVSHPIIGADFLKTFGLLVDMKKTASSTRALEGRFLFK
ncbi:hypothetical protein AVEN_156341-1 [Araneus ventricosus]|uniref:Peptidase A2 domain-containing protein n=2 Tax=Araneus ventricosus TaxID=182803 RepID=A0A4Y2FHC1_ARAVE|nr:hypothetical protein AVEN_25784-1 [Araneus ventricosus]GBM40970.1 hypothetical protein AVEN_75733-1 [Araneus ventricosus]GBM41001.1 hypothetical protein AVEN_156341-1 [Araneus ventricosus]